MYILYLLRSLSDPMSSLCASTSYAIPFCTLDLRFWKYILKSFAVTTCQFLFIVSSVFCAFNLHHVHSLGCTGSSWLWVIALSSPGGLFFLAFCLSPNFLNECQTLCVGDFCWAVSVLELGGQELWVAQSWHFLLLWLPWVSALAWSWLVTYWFPTPPTASLPPWLSPPAGAPCLLLVLADQGGGAGYSFPLSFRRALGPGDVSLPWR